MRAFPLCAAVVKLVASVTVSLKQQESTIPVTYIHDFQLHKYTSKHSTLHNSAVLTSQPHDEGLNFSPRSTEISLLFENLTNDMGMKECQENNCILKFHFRMTRCHFVDVTWRFIK